MQPLTNSSALDCSACVHRFDTSSGCFPQKRTQCPIGSSAKATPNKGMNCSGCMHMYETTTGCSLHRKRQCNANAMALSNTHPAQNPAPAHGAVNPVTDPNCLSCSYRYETSGGCSPLRKKQCIASAMARKLRLGWICAQCGKSLSPDIQSCDCIELIKKRIEDAAQKARSEAAQNQNNAKEKNNENT